MYRLIKSHENINSNNYIHPYTLEELVEFIDDAIAESRISASSHNSEVPESISSKPVYSFYVSSDFEKGVKRLNKDHKTKELTRLKEVITMLGEYGTVNGKYGDHRVGSKYRELKLSDNKNVLLVYAFVPGADIISVSIELADITDHRNLNKSTTSEHRLTKEYINDENFDTDEIIKN